MPMAAMVTVQPWFFTVAGLSITLTPLVHRATRIAVDCVKKAVRTVGKTCGTHGHACS
jgi:hypothetical protein